MKKIYFQAFKQLLFAFAFFTSFTLFGQDCPSLNPNIAPSISCNNNVYSISVSIINPGGKSGAQITLSDNSTICFLVNQPNTFTYTVTHNDLCSDNLSLVSITFHESVTCSNAPCSGEGSLPVSLVSFTGELIQNSVKLEWQTAQEVQNEMFNIERSTDGENWKTIGQIPGAVNSQAIVSYEFMDKSPVNGNNYYRLVQQDLDGQKNPSHIIQVAYSSDLWEPTIVLHQVNKSLQIYTRTAEGKATVHVYNLNGQLLVNEIVQDGEFKSLQHLTAGTYICQLVNDQNTFVKKIILNN